MAETQEMILDFDNAKSGRVNLDTGTYSSTTGWVECGTGRTTAFNRWRAFFSFDTSALPDEAVIEKVTMNIRRRADGYGEPETYVLKFSIGTFIGASLDGDVGEWTGGTQCQVLTTKPADKENVVMNTVALALVNRTGDTDLKLWDDSSQGTGDPSWETNFNKNTTFRCQLYIQYTEARAGIATGKGTSSAAGTYEAPLNGTATATGKGTSSGTAVLEIPGSATAVGKGTSSATAVQVLTRSASATGVGFAAGLALIILTATASVMGVGTASGAAVLEIPGSAAATGIATSSGAATYSVEGTGSAVVTGLGSTSGAAILEIPGSAAVTGVGTSSGAAVLEIPGAASVTGVGTSSGAGTYAVAGNATATVTGKGSASGVATVEIPEPLALHEATISVASYDGATISVVVRDSATIAVDPDDAETRGPRRAN